MGCQQGNDMLFRPVRAHSRRRSYVTDGYLQVG